jgi:isoleucyl-tRNA synthetase
MRVEKPEKTIDFPAMERKVLEKWDAEDTFRRSVETRPASRAYNFYDGPPFATGLPHFGHFLPSSIKDAFPRYFTMRGHRVERRFGWDCHGLPIEMLIQKELGLNGRADIEAFGVAKFNEACRASVLRYTTEWRAYMKRLGRWVDMDDEYRTMDRDFMESVWAVIKRLFEKGLVYEGYTVMSYSAALGSTLSNSEASLDYRDVQDPSVTVKARLLDGPHAGKSLLVWTTTPWTLPANVAVAIDAEGSYVEVVCPDSGESFVLLEERLGDYWKTDAVEKRRVFKGAELAGSRYEPFFPHWAHRATAPHCFRVLATDYVLHDTGTGAVHTAPAFGEDDFRCAKQYDLPVIDHLDVNGRYLPGNLEEVVGLSFKDGDKPLMADLKKRGFVFRHETFVHPYPFCYRSGTPLLYRASPSWFVRVESFRDRLVAANQDIAWVPEHIKEGRFGKWIENARDWNIGRSRYWGNPIPVWKNDATGELACLGSVAELEAKAGRKIPDIHMEFIDDVTWPGEGGVGTFRRVPFVLDCWFESGSMPYAQLHWPFDVSDAELMERFPADFICEGLDQTRGWFYNLMNLSVALFDAPAFKNVVVNGLVMAGDGRKMSKSLKNYADPMETLDLFGADSLRLFLLTSPGTAGEEVRFNVESVKENTRRVLLPLWNAYSFFATYASLDGFDPETDRAEGGDELDLWVKLRLDQMLRELDDAMTTYHIAKAAPAVVTFLDDLNNWYIRRNRRRFWDSDRAAYTALFDVLVRTSQALAPFAPFAAEYFYGKLALTTELGETGSVHLSLLPEPRLPSAAEAALLDRVALARRVVELGRNIRTQHKLKNRQPLSRLTVGVVHEAQADALRTMADVIRDELNVKEVVVTRESAKLATVLVKPNFKVLGKSLGERIKELQGLLAALPQEQAAKALRKETLTVGDFTLPPEALTVELRGSGVELVATDADLVASLDPTLTEELRLEGLARELVSLVQKARKSGGFEVEDRLHLRVEASTGLLAALEKNRAYLEEETLCSLHPTLEGGDQSECDVEGEKVVLHLKKRNA